MFLVKCFDSGRLVLCTITVSWPVTLPGLGGGGDREGEGECQVRRLIGETCFVKIQRLYPDRTRHGGGWLLLLDTRVDSVFVSGPRKQSGIRLGLGATLHFHFLLGRLDERKMFYIIHL